MNFEVETAFPYAARFRVVGKRDAGSDAPAGVRFVGGHGDMASFYAARKFTYAPRSMARKVRMTRKPRFQRVKTRRKAAFCWG